jgi:hypothetical protein
MYEEPPLLSIEARDCLEGFVAEAADEFLELGVIDATEREDWRGHALAEGVPHTVALSLYARGPTLYMDVSYEQLVPAARVFVYLEPKFGRLIKLMTLDEYEVFRDHQRRGGLREPASLRWRH